MNEEATGVDEEEETSSASESGLPIPDLKSDIFIKENFIYLTIRPNLPKIPRK